MLNKKNIYFLIFKFLLVLLEIKKKIQTNFKFKFLIPGIWTPNMDPQYGPRIWTPNWTPNMEPHFVPTKWTPKYGPSIWTTNMDPQYGPQIWTPIWTPNMDPQ
jgi:hypothetical protein